MQEQGGQRPTVQDLPSPLLGRIFELAGGAECRRTRLSILLTCRHWRHAFYSPDCPLWHTLTLRQPEYSGSGCLRRAQRLLDAWLDATARLLPRIGPAVAAAHLMPALEPTAPAGALGYPSITAWVAALSPAALRSLHLDCSCPGGAASTSPGCGADAWEHLRQAMLPAPAIAQLPGFQHLTQLRLSCWALPTCTPAVLGRLRQLAVLRVWTEEVPGELMAGILRRTSLKSLGLRTFRQLPPMGSLSSLTQLEALSLQQRNAEGEGIAWPAAWPASLQTLMCKMECRSCQVADVHLQGCKLSRNALGSGRAELSLHGICTMPALRPLLDALLPACGQAQLCSLAFEACLLGAAALEGCGPLLANLSQLCIDTCSCVEEDEGEDEDGGEWGEAGMGAVLGAMLRQAPRLEELSVLSTNLSRLPRVLIERRGIRRLALTTSVLYHIPLEQGPYLQDMQELTLPRTYTCVPETLRRATALCCLRLQDGRSSLELTPRCLEILLGLPRLQRLELGRAGSTPVALLWQLFQGKPGMEVA